MQTESDWRLALREARRAALASLSPEQAAQRVADEAAEKEARAARRKAKVNRALLCNQRIALGDTPEEIAAAFNVSEKYFYHVLVRRGGHALVRRKGYRRLPTWVADRDVAALDALAVEMDVSREKMLGLIVGDALASGAFVARRRRRAAA